ncbi:MAG TPA: right-handed parallel beta-helix repeat-containing protein, partial [Thermoanaerobaculia bacterium]|nr:right-handed parallel beta-helix repeat-containing protein [Thermoanaerobaculia bacterium]
MSRLLSLLLLVVATLSSFAQPVTLVTEISPRVAVVDPGASATFQASVANPGEFRATDLRVRFELAGDAAIERIDSPNGWTCTMSGKSAECATPIVVIVARRFDVTVRAGSTNGGATTLTMTASSAEPVAGQQYIARATLQAYQTLAVETTADAGPGSLRAAIETANALGHVSKIEFRLPAPVPAEGWFTIIPATPLPPITARRVYVDGKSQTRFTGDTNTRGPEIAIDGRLAHRGLEIHSPCLARVEGLTLGNFDANQGLWFTKSGECTDFSFESDVRLVADNYIGTDPTGTVAWPNLRGLRGDFGSGTIRNNVISGNTYSGMWIWVSTDRYASYTIEGNKFGTAADGIAPLPNGAAGMLLGDRVSADVRRNVIANHPGMGIALVRGDTYVRIQENSMRDNGGIGIDWGIDGTSSDTLD